MLLVSPFAKLSALDLQNYEGGDNPILLWLFIAGVVLIAVGATAWILYMKWREARIWEMCQERELSLEEYGFLRSFAKKFHERDFTTLITKKSAFDRFLNKVSHHYESISMTSDDLASEATLLEIIRTKLGFPHNYKDKRLRSSRALPVNHPLTITFSDKGTKRGFTFHSKVIVNNEFFLGITPPDNEIGKETFESKKLPLTVMLTRENDAEYFYGSNLVRVLSYPKAIWIVRHSDKLDRGAEHRRLDLPAKITISEADGESSADHQITIVHLNRDGARFRFNEQSVEPSTPSSALLMLKSGEESQLVRVQIAEKLRRDNERYFRIQFKDLSEEQSLWLNRFAHSLRETPDASASLMKSTKNKSASKPAASSIKE
ncbi:hypothetical protein SCG7086_BA_00090 [Chlamydiales bacterium SCGC AG-110-P3]|nr:hypothetical protein SCG7086_BA_00090 [Chlamydiales bacterium SCGC AG-110-P3]